MESMNISENSSTSQQGSMNQSLRFSSLNESSLSPNAKNPMAVSIIQVLIGAIILLFNLITTVGLVRCRGINMLLKMLLIIQAFSDTLVGNIFIYHSIIVRVDWFNITECIVRYSLLTITSAMSLVTVFMISVERVLAIKLPYKHQDVTSSRLVMRLIGLYCLISPIILVSIEFQFINRDITDCNMLLLVPMSYYAGNGSFGVVLNVLMIICNIYLFKASRDHIKKIVPTFVGPNKFKRGIQLNLKATLTSASVIVPFIILNLPMYTMFLSIWIVPSLQFNPMSRHIADVVYSLAVMNSIVNPIMYTWRLKDLRDQIKRKFGIKAPQQDRNT